MRTLVFFLLHFFVFTLFSVSIAAQQQEVTTKQNSVADAPLDSAAAVEKPQQQKTEIADSAQDKTTVATGDTQDRPVDKDVSATPVQAAETGHSGGQNQAVTENASTALSNAKQNSKSPQQTDNKTSQTGVPATSSRRQSKSATEQNVILAIITQLNGLNAKLLDSKDEKSVNQFLNDKNQLLSKLMPVLRDTFLEELPASASNDELNLLSSRININQKRGNDLAVLRDQVKLEYFRSDQKIRDFLVYLIVASNNYASVGEIIETAQHDLAEDKQNNVKFKLPKDIPESAVYSALKANYAELQQVKMSYVDLLNYVIDNPRAIASTHWFQNFSIYTAISYINQFDFLRSLNHKLFPLRVDVGGISVSFAIFFLVFFSYPFVFKCTSWVVEKYILDDASENEELIYHGLRRPIRFLFIFIGVHLATYALFYKAHIKGPLGNVAYVIYTIIISWFFFKVLDSIVISQFHEISRSNKALRKELINLGLRTAKGVIIIVAFGFVFSHFGISFSAIMSTLGIGGLAFALAAKDSLSNLFGGVTILFDNVFGMGDWVKISDFEGTVVEIGLRSTTIRTFDNALVSIPNSLISVSSVMNWNRRAVGRRIKMYIGVTYESDMDDIRQALQDIREMLQKHEGIANPKQQINRMRQFRLSSHEDSQGIKSTQLVFMDRYSDFSIDILIYCFSRSVNWTEWLQIKEDVLFKIADILKKNNLNFAYPTQVRIYRPENRTPMENMPFATQN